MTDQTPTPGETAAADQADAMAKMEAREEWAWADHVRAEEAKTQCLVNQAAYEKARGEFFSSLAFAVYISTVGAAGYIIVLAVRGVVRWFG